MLCHATFYIHRNKETVLQDQDLPLIDWHSAAGQVWKECSEKPQVHLWLSLIPQIPLVSFSTSAHTFAA